LVVFEVSYCDGFCKKIKEYSREKLGGGGGGEKTCLSLL
jgi:hypothetical protein